METLTQLREPADSPATSNSNPRRVMLNCYGSCWSSSVVSDARTAAAARTSTGQHLLISFGLAAPPATSSLYYEYNRAGAAPLDNKRVEDPVVIAAGDAAILLQARVPDRWSSVTDSIDYFLYDAGRLSSLALLPARRFPMVHERGRTRHDSRARRLHTYDTGLLRRGGGDGILVTQLEVCYDYDYDRPPDKPCPNRMPRGTAELCLLRPGSCEWELTRDVPIVVGDGDKAARGGGVKELLRGWDDTDAVVSVGDRFLCWVNYLRGFLLWDTASSPKLLYVRLPAELPGHGQSPTRAYRNMSAAGTGAVRLVSVSIGESTCASSRYTFTVTMWTLSLTGDKPAPAVATTWVKDCEELWALPGYEGLPRVPVEYPILCSDDDDPHVVYFLIRNEYGCYLG